MPRAGVAAGRQPGPLRARAARARAEHQLRHVPRRVHAERSRLLRSEAQRGERREQPRRQRRQPELELRRRRPDRRSGDRATAQPPGEELPDAAAARRGHADAADGRRGPPHAARQQQRVLPGQRDVLVRLVAARAARATSAASSASLIELRTIEPLSDERHRMTLRSCCARSRSTGTASGSTSRTGATTRTRSRPRCRWPAARGLQVIVNAYREPLTFAIPSRSEGLSDWQRVIDTSLEAPNDICQWSDATAIVDGHYSAGPRSVVLLRAERSQS